ncbi:MAG: Rho-binding antiterminator [Nitrosomonas sp.]|jgi:Rho-binding antiterminator|nr:Rho-binding antiterminator [Nitrosomonas sp.]MCC7136603.1 Rho-binding antiterminator [Nitrosomonas sp.]
MTNELISCELHDYIEVVCMYRYQIRLVLKDDSTIEGKARDILTTPDKKEFLLLEADGGSQQIELTKLRKLEVLSPNPQFREVVFPDS